MRFQCVLLRELVFNARTISAQSTYSITATTASVRLRTLAKTGWSAGARRNRNVQDHSSTQWQRPGLERGTDAQRVSLAALRANPGPLLDRNTATLPSITREFEAQRNRKAAKAAASAAGRKASTSNAPAATATLNVPAHDGTERPQVPPTRLAAPSPAAPPSPPPFQHVQWYSCGRTRVERVRPRRSIGAGVCVLLRPWTIHAYSSSS